MGHDGDYINIMRHAKRRLDQGGC